MPQETYPTWLEVLLSILKYLLPASLVGSLGFYLALITLPPELVIEAVDDKSKKDNSKSRIRIKNIGKLPAQSIKADVINFNTSFATNRFTNCTAVGLKVIGRLANNESSEISVTPGIQIGIGGGFDEFIYTLVLNYHFKFLFFKKHLSKKWKVELCNFKDGFSWNITIIST